MRRSAGPCRSVMVPTMISRSAWRGEKRGNSAPKRAMSYLGAATDMNSMPQQAVTNGYWNSDHLRAQLRAASRFEVCSSVEAMSLPADRALPPDVGERDDQDAHEDQDLADPEEGDARPAHACLERARAGERAVADGPRVEERRLDVEHQEEDGHLVELDLEAGARAADHLGAALVRVVLRLAGAAPGDGLRDHRQQECEPGAAHDGERC